jgi:hypothetical protein
MCMMHYLRSTRNCALADLFDADRHYLGSLDLPVLPPAFTADGTALLRIVREEGPEVCFTARERIRNGD